MYNQKKSNRFVPILVSLLLILNLPISVFASEKEPGIGIQSAGGLTSEVQEQDIQNTIDPSTVEPEDNSIDSPQEEKTQTDIDSSSNEDESSDESDVPDQEVAATDVELALLEIDALTVTPEEDTEYDGYIVKIKDEFVDAEMIEAAPGDPIAESIFVIEELEEVLEFAEPEQIEYIEPNLIFSMLDFPATAPNDNDYSNHQWNLKSSPGINIQSTWNRGLNGTGARVAVIDSGVNASHRDFASYTIQPGYDFTDDGNLVGTNVADGYGHGTMVTSIIAANTNNSLNVAGVSYGSKIIPFKVFRDDGSASLANLVGALTKIESMSQIDVINLSLGTDVFSQALQDQINRLSSKGIIIVAAVGNGWPTNVPVSSRNYTVNLYPASMNNVLGVASVNTAGTQSSFSQYNSSVDIAAPGEAIYGLSNSNNDNSNYGSGTSYASPHIAALAAIAKGYNHSISQAQFEALIAESAIDKGDPGLDVYYGAGIIDANTFVNKLVSYYSSSGASANTESYENGKWYLCDWYGRHVTDWYNAPDGRRLYYDGENGRVFGSKLIGGRYYYFSPSDGTMQKGWVSTGGKDYYYDTVDGYLVTGIKTISGKECYFSPATGVLVTGQVQIGSDHYYFYGKNGKFCNSEAYIDGKWYYFGPDGKRIRNDWANLPDGRRVYQGDDGNRVYGSALIKGKYYYFSSANGAMQKGWFVMGGQDYYYDPVDGYLVTGKKMISGKECYFSPSTGALVTGQVLINGKYYFYYGKNGKYCGSEAYIDGKWFYFAKTTGERAEGFCDLPDGRRVYYDGNNGRATGSKLIGGKYYYFNPANGAMQKGWFTNNGVQLYYDLADGHLAIGVKKVDGKECYFSPNSGALVTGQVIIGADYLFYYGKNGKYCNSEAYVDGKWYYYGADGKRINGFWNLPDGRRVYYDGNNGRVTGSKLVGGKYYFFDQTNGAMQKGWVSTGGQDYYYDPVDGYLVTGKRVIGGRECYMSPATGALVNGQVLINGKYYFYYGKNGKYGGSEAYIDGKWFYFASNTGERIDGWWNLPDGRHVYYDGNNGRATGSKLIGGKYYYFDPVSGAMQKGWVTLGASQYYFDLSNGSLVVGIKVIDGKECYFDPATGAMVTGEVQINGVKYYYDGRNGKVTVSPFYLSGWKYELDGNGAIIGRTYAGTPMRGVDVSEWQGTIDWGQVRASGIEFAIIRAGWTDWKVNDSGAYFHRDVKFIENVRNAKAHGIKVGTYIYVYSRDIAEQQIAIANFHTYCVQNGLTFDLPVFLDVEDSDYYLPSTNALGGYNYRTIMLQVGLDQLRSYGYKPGFYTFLNWANNHFDSNFLYSQGNAFWLANWYGNNAELDPNIASWNGRFPSIWQYRSTGRVPGISGNVDMNYLYPGNM